MAEQLDLSTVVIDPACVVKLPAAFALRRLVLPLSRVDGAFAVAMADPDDAPTCALVEREVGCAVKAYRADSTQLREELLKLYGENRAGMSTAAAVEEPVAQVDRLLRAALLRHASDVHFDPGRDGLRVRFRTDGELEDVATIPAALQPAVTSRLKVLAGLDIAERRAPQDGAFTWRMTGAGAQRMNPLDVRMATLPVRHGERVTLRLLETDGARLTLDGLGLAADDRAVFDDVLTRPHGLVLLTGPTGSGKTTTLYAAIQQLLSRRALNILTVEDPIEYEIPGVGQAEVDSADKVNFAKALRSLLRHDPDVIRIVAVCDRQADKLEELEGMKDVKLFSDFDSFLDYGKSVGMNAVFLANYFHQHAEYAIKAMENGMDVVSECTSAATLKGCVDLVRCVERTGRKYMIAENYPFSTENLEMKRVMTL